MAYQLYYASGTGTITVLDNTANTQTLLVLPGKDYVGYGSLVDQNMLSMIENFASYNQTQMDNKAIRGQLWFDTATNKLKYNISSSQGIPNWFTLATANDTALTTATTTTLGSIKVGSGLAISADGTLSAIGDGSGTVTSVGLSMPSGFTVSGSPVTGAGTLSVSTTLNGIISANGSGFAAVTIGNGLSYDGGTLNVSTATSTTLGSVKVGSGLSIASDGTLSSIGTVTSVNVSGGTTGLTASGGPITGAGTITLDGVLTVANGGTGATNTIAALNAILPAQSTATIGSYLTSDGTNATWNSAFSSATSNGYTVLPGGIMLQWGNSGGTALSNGSPVSFPTSFFGTPWTITGSDADGNNTFGALNWTPAGFIMASSGALLTFSWLAIGLAPPPGSPTNVTITQSAWVVNGDGTSSITMTANATSSSPVTYSWSYVDLNAGVISWTASGNSATITTNNNIFEASAGITVTATNSIGSASKSITVVSPNYTPPPE